MDLNELETHSDNALRQQHNTMDSDCPHLISGSATPSLYDSEHVILSLNVSYNIYKRAILFM